MPSPGLLSRLRGRNSVEPDDEGVMEIPLMLLGREERLESKMPLVAPSRKLLVCPDEMPERKLVGVGAGKLWL